MSQMILNSIAGFVDLPDANIAAHSIVTDDSLTKIAQNAVFAAVRSETIFMGYFKHGDKVGTAVSPVDGYAYELSEMQFECTLYSTRAPGVNFGAPGGPSGFQSGQGTAPAIAASQPANLYWTLINCDDATGQVTIDISYYKQGGSETISHDGIAKVMAFCQRQSVNVPS